MWGHDELGKIDCFTVVPVKHVEQVVRLLLGAVVLADASLDELRLRHLPVGVVLHEVCMLFPHLILFLVFCQNFALEEAQIATSWYWVCELHVCVCVLMFVFCVCDCICVFAFVSVCLCFVLWLAYLYLCVCFCVFVIYLTSSSRTPSLRASWSANSPSSSISLFSATPQSWSKEKRLNSQSFFPQSWAEEKRKTNESSPWESLKIEFLLRPRLISFLQLKGKCLGHHHFYCKLSE